MFFEMQLCNRHFQDANILVFYFSDYEFCPKMGVLLSVSVRSFYREQGDFSKVHY